MKYIDFTIFLVGGFLTLVAISEQHWLAMAAFGCAALLGAINIIEFDK